LLFYCNNGSTNAPQYDVICTLPVVLYTSFFTMYGLNSQSIVVRLPAVVRDIPFLQKVQTGFGAHTHLFNGYIGQLLQRRNSHGAKLTTPLQLVPR